MGSGLVALMTLRMILFGNVSRIELLVETRMRNKLSMIGPLLVIVKISSSQ